MLDVVGVFECQWRGYESDGFWPTRLYIICNRVTPVWITMLPADGTREVGGHTYLIMEDLTAGYQQPCILDIKVSMVYCCVKYNVQYD